MLVRLAAMDLGDGPLVFGDAVFSLLVMVCLLSISFPLFFLDLFPLFLP